MIIGIGVDIVTTKDINLDSAFTRRVFSKKEQAEAETHYDKKVYYAERFAVKEAVAKAIYSIKPDYDMRSVETISNSAGAPVATFLSPYQNWNQQYHVHVSLSNEKNIVIAFVVIEKR